MDGDIVATLRHEVRPKGYRPGGIGLDAFAAHIQRELPIRAEMVKLSGARPQKPVLRAPTLPGAAS